MRMNECDNCKYNGNMCTFLYVEYAYAIQEIHTLANRGFNYYRQKTQQVKPEANPLFDLKFKCNGFKRKKR